VPDPNPSPRPPPRSGEGEKEGLLPLSASGRGPGGGVFQTVDKVSAASCPMTKVHEPVESSTFRASPSVQETSHAPRSKLGVAAGRSRRMYDWLQGVRPAQEGARRPASP